MSSSKTLRLFALSSSIFSRAVHLGPQRDFRRPRVDIVDEIKRWDCSNVVFTNKRTIFSTFDPLLLSSRENSLKICVGRRGKGMPDPLSAQLRSCMNSFRPLPMLIFRFLFSKQSVNLYDATYTGKCPV